MSSKVVEYQAATKLRVISNAKQKLKSERKKTTDMTALSFPVLSYNIYVIVSFVSQECRGSICVRFGLLECQCQQEDHFCDLCCKNGEVGECKPLTYRGIGNVTKTLQQVPGAPCNNFNGYCDVFLKCRAVVEYSVSNLQFFFNQYLSRGIQFSTASLNGALT